MKNRELFTEQMANNVYVFQSGYRTTTGNKKSIGNNYQALKTEIAWNPRSHRSKSQHI